MADKIPVVVFKDNQPGISALLKGHTLKFTALGEQANIINTSDGIDDSETIITGFSCTRVADENEIAVALRHAFVEGLIPLGPTAAARYGFGGRMEFFLGDGGEGKEKGGQ